MLAAVSQLFAQAVASGSPVSGLGDADFGEASLAASAAASGQLAAAPLLGAPGTRLDALAPGSLVRVRGMARALSASRLALS